jgi:hypothetical protein
MARTPSAKFAEHHGDDSGKPNFGAGVGIGGPPANRTARPNKHQTNNKQRADKARRQRCCLIE